MTNYGNSFKSTKSQKTQIRSSKLVKLKTQMGKERKMKTFELSVTREEEEEEETEKLKDQNL